MLLHEILQNGRGEDIAVIDRGRRITYDDLREALRASRDRFYAAGIRAHDHVALFSHNRVELLVAYLALNSLGAVAVPLNYQLSVREVAYIIKDAGARHLVTEKELPLESHLGQQGYGGELMQLPLLDVMKPASAMPAPKLSNVFSPENPCVIIYTSGTTGAPKGAVLSHVNQRTNAYQVMEHHAITKSDRVLCVLPMYHCFAWTCSVLATLAAGGTIVIVNGFMPKETIRAIREEEVTIMYAVPSVCAILTRQAAAEDLKSLRLTGIGGTALPQEIAKAYREKFGLTIYEVYGLSEASPVVTMDSPRHYRPGSIGVPLRGLEVIIANTDGKELPRGMAGELLVKGPTVMKGYWHQAEATARAIKNGWLHTGDIARMDEDGFVYIVDRIKDMIISMGENVYPREIEELVYSFPGIEDAAVIAIPDPLRGQAGACYYTVKKNEEVDMRTLKKFLQKNLAVYKVPREFCQISEMPRTSTGKIAKREIARRYRKDT